MAEESEEMELRELGNEDDDFEPLCQPGPQGLKSLNVCPTPEKNDDKEKRGTNPYLFCCIGASLLVTLFYVYVHIVD